MEPESSADKLAKVTYLFGIKPEVDNRRITDSSALAPRDSGAVSTAQARAHNFGLSGLARRNMSVAEMTTLLESRDIDDEEVEAEIERLERVGLLDDQALAETLVRTLHERKGLGKSAIETELRRRGIDPCILLDALQLIDGDDELNRAIEVAEKRAGQLRSYDAATAKRRLYAYMQRRGYNGPVLTQAVDAALAPMQSKGPRFR